MTVKAVPAALAVIAAAGAIVLTGAGPAAASPCGYWQDAPSSYYTHCVGQQGGNLWIRVEIGSKWWQECVPPGTTKLDGGIWGIGPLTDNAKSLDIACFDPGLMIFMDGRKWHRR